jgi:hypothetical protein
MSATCCAECNQVWGVVDKDMPLEGEPLEGTLDQIIVSRVKNGSNACVVCDQTRRFNFDNEEMSELNTLRANHPPLAQKYDERRTNNCKFRSWCDERRLMRFMSNRKSFRRLDVFVGRYRFIVHLCLSLQYKHAIAHILTSRHRCRARCLRKVVSILSTGCKHKYMYIYICM